MEAWRDLEVVAQLIRLNDEGFSASNIAERLGNGISRNAVISKLSRMGIKMHNAGTHAPRPRRWKAPGDQHQAKSPPIPMEPLIEAKDVVPIGLSLMDLGSRHCHWPYGDSPPFKFCGHSVAAGKNLCQAHWQIAHPKQPATGHAKGSGGGRQTISRWLKC